MAYQSIAYRVETFGESPDVAAAHVEAYMRAQLGVEVNVTAQAAA